MSNVEPTKKEENPLKKRMDALIGILRDEGREKQQKLSKAKITPQMETCMRVFTEVFFTVNGKIKLKKIPNKNDEAVISKDKKAKECIEELTKPMSVALVMVFSKKVTWMGSNWLLGAEPPKDTAKDNDFTSQSQNWSDFLHLSYGVRTVFLKKEKKWNIDAILKDLEEFASKQAGFGKKVKNRAQELAKKEGRDNKPVDVDFFLAYEIETHEGINQAALDPLNDMIATIAGVKLYEDITKNKVKITTVKEKIVVDLEHYLKQGWKEFRKKSPKYLMELKGKFEKMIRREELPEPPDNLSKKYQIWKSTLGNILKEDKVKKMNEVDWIKYKNNFKKKIESKPSLKQMIEVFKFLPVTKIIEVKIGKNGKVTVTPNPAEVANGDVVKWHIKGNEWGAHRFEVILPKDNNSPFGNVDEDIPKWIEEPQPCKSVIRGPIEWPKGVKEYRYDVRFSKSPEQVSLTATLIDPYSCWEKKEVPDGGWPLVTGDYEVGDPESCVAISSTGSYFHIENLPGIAIQGSDKTENIGLEKIMANIISNPNIRFLIVAGAEVPGHISGGSLLKLHEKGIDKESHKIVDAQGAIPFIENVPLEAVERFRQQVEVIDMLGVEDYGAIMAKVNELKSRDSGAYPEDPMIVKVGEEEKEEAELVIPLEKKKQDNRDAP